MLNIEKFSNGSELTMALTGRLDTTTSPDLERDLRDSIDGITELTIDMGGLDYISSAGLRVLLSAQKIMNKQGAMKVVNVNAVIMQIFNVTGFSQILDIQ
ncbi:MAG: STAS domain-containing protein [Lachnospiraceae bacterium]|nr:STAS domain-containing protein [Lachnospiraceae bacterium]